MRSRVWCIAVACACWTVAATGSLCAVAQEGAAADWLPPTTVLYVEAAEAQSFLELPLAQQIVANPLFQELWRGPEAMKLRGGITLAELALGERVPAALIKATTHGATLAVDSETQGVVLLAHAKDAATCEQLVSKLVQLAQRREQKPNVTSNVKRTEYRGLTAYEIDQGVLTSFGDWLLVTNKGELASKIVDNYRDSSAQSLAKAAAFTASREGLQAKREGERLIWAWADVAQLKARGVAKDLFKRPDENFVAELVLGGLLASIREASTATAVLTCDGEQLQLDVNLRGTAAVSQPEYEFFFGKDAVGIAPEPVRLQGELLSLAAYRDVAQLWRRAGDLFGQRTNDQLAVADATLTTLFSGKDFGEEILGAIEPGVQIVAKTQDFGSDGSPQPSLKLPAFALITKLRQPSEMQPQLRRIFMSLIGFINITGAMNQQPQLDIEAVREDDAHFVVATYAADEDRPEDWAVPIQFNFSPTLALVGEHAVLASTEALARDIVRTLRAQAEVGTGEAGQAGVTGKPAAPNTLLVLQGAPITEALMRNRDQMISQNILEKGHTPEEAAREIDTLLRLAGLVDSLEVKLGVGTDVEIKADLRLKP